MKSILKIEKQKSEKLEESLSQIVSVSEAVDYLKISKSNLYKLTSRKEIPHYKPGGKKIYFKKSDLENWILSGKVVTTLELELDSKMIGS